MCRHLIIDSGKKSTGNRFSFKLPSKEVAILGMIAFLSMLCEGAMFDWAGVYFKKVLGIEGAMMTAGYVAFMSTMAGTRFVADFFKEKIGFRNILLISGLLVFSGLMIATGFNNLISCIIGFLMVGSGVSAVVPLTFSESGKVSPENQSGTVAVISTIGFLGFLFGPPAIGWIAEISSLRFSFFLIGIMGLVMGMSHLFLSKRN
jgi:MFS family permease